MRCEVCGQAERQTRLIRYSFSEGDQLLVVDHVSAEVCPHRGEVSLHPDVVERLQDTVWHHRAPVRLIETPVYEFTPSAFRRGEWAPGVSYALGRHLLQMVQHLDRHKSQLFYYLKLQGKPVNTADLWG